MIRSKKPWAAYTRLTQDRNGLKEGRKIQRRYIGGWGERAGVEIGHVFDDTNMSASDDELFRPEFEQMLAEVREGRWGGIVFFKVDRLTRNVMQFELAQKAAVKGGGYLAEAYSGRTTETPSGVQMMRHDVGIAEAEIQNLKIRVSANKQERSRKGYYHGGGHRPYGFEAPKKSKDGRVKNSGRVGVKHVQHEVDNLREAARRRLDGESFTEIVRDWHARQPPVYGATGAPWNIKTLQECLTSPRMIGKQWYRKTDPETGEVVQTLRKARWKPVLDVDTWERLVALKTTQEHAPIADYNLSGLALCGRCRLPLTGARRSYLKGGVRVGVRTYRCRAGMNDKARGHCGKLSVLADDVENLIAGRILARFKVTGDLAVEVIGDDEPHVELARLNTEVEHCRQELEVLASAGDDPDQMMSASQMLAYRKPYLERIKKAEARRGEIKRQLAIPTPDAADYADLPGWWKMLSCAQQRTLIEDVFAEIVVLAPGRSGRYFRPERVVATPAGPKNANHLVA